MSQTRMPMLAREPLPGEEPVRLVRLRTDWYHEVLVGGAELVVRAEVVRVAEKGRRSGGPDPGDGS